MKAAFSATWVALLAGMVPHASSIAAARPASTQPASVRPASVQPASVQPTGRIVEFKPGIRINYPKRQVEVDAKVCMRRGLLELFACSYRTREYESIVVIGSRPLHVYQALGLLGLVPGRPMRILPDGEVVPAEGESLEIDVAYEVKGERRVEPVERWMRRSRPEGAPDGAPDGAFDGPDAPLERQTWVFAGSIPIENGAIAADEEGTVVAVVDFPSAIVALPRHHTASNAELWLEPNTPAIPPIDTTCTLIFRQGPWRLRLDEAGRLYLAGKPISQSELARQLRQAKAETPDLRVLLEAHPQTKSASTARLQRLFESLGVALKTPPTSGPSPSGDRETTVEHP